MESGLSRRQFIQSGASAAAAIALTIPDVFSADQAKSQLIWGALLHMGTNMWSDVPVKTWGPIKPEDLHLVCQADHLRFDEAVWRTLTDRMQKAGMNLLVIDLGEALEYQSHPELAVKGSWPVEKFRTELARLRAMGLEPIPKLNFSTTHDAWLKEYRRQISTPAYYRVCADLVKEVCEIFDKPRWFHLGYDEETAANQSQYGYVVVRQGELWWHDFLLLSKEVERQGVRPWIWSDYCWHHPEEFINRMPKSVLQSNWYYDESFDPAKQPIVRSYLDLDQAGFDQIPTGSNWSNDTNFRSTVSFCRKNLAPQRLKGFLMAPWNFTLKAFEDRNLRAIDQVGDAIREKV